MVLICLPPSFPVLLYRHITSHTGTRLLRVLSSNTEHARLFFLLRRTRQTLKVHLWVKALFSVYLPPPVAFSDGCLLPHRLSETIIPGRVCHLSRPAQREATSPPSRGHAAASAWLNITPRRPSLPEQLGRDAFFFGRGGLLPRSSLIW